MVKGKRGPVMVGPYGERGTRGPTKVAVKAGGFYQELKGFIIALGVPMCKVAINCFLFFFYLTPIGIWTADGELDARLEPFWQVAK